MLLEKAFAKLHGCYEMIADGSARDALVALTGAPTKIYFHDEFPDVCEHLLSADLKDYVMTASSKKPEGAKGDDVAPNGLVYAHCYTVIGVFEVTDPDSGE